MKLTETICKKITELLYKDELLGGPRGCQGIFYQPERPIISTDHSSHTQSTYSSDEE